MGETVVDQPRGAAPDVRRIQLPGGQLIWAQVENSESGEFRDVGAADKARHWLVEGFPETLRAVAENVETALREYRPHEVSVTFAVQFSIQTGSVVSVLAQAGGNANVSVQLTWKNDKANDSTARPGR